MAKGNKPGRRKLVRKFRPQVKAEARLRFGSETASLKGQLRDAAAQYVDDLAAADTGAAGIKAAARAARPQLRSNAAEGARSISTIESALGDALKQASDGGGTVGKLMALSTTGDAGRVKARLETQMRDAVRETLDREQEAESGRVYSRAQARAALEGARHKVNAQLQEVSGQRGAFTQQRLAELIDAERKARATARENRLDRGARATEGRRNRRNSRVTAGVNPDGSVIRGGKADPDGDGKAGTKKAGAEKLPGGVKPLETAGQNAARSDVKAARRDAERLRKSGRSRAAARGLLISGRKEQKLVDPDLLRQAEREHPDWTVAQQQKAATVPIPGVPKYREYVVAAALDMAYVGHLSPATQRMLWQAGVRARKLGVPFRKGGQPAPGARRGRRGPNRVGTTAPGSNGQNRPT